MKAITETMLRYELRNLQPEVFVVPEGKILTPAGREYLNQRKIKIERAGRKVRTAGRYNLEPEQTTGRFRDYETGKFYQEKPEHMTHLHGNILVAKNHERIRFRGQLDRLQALIIMAQADITEFNDTESVISDLDNILDILREIMRCEVLDKPFENEFIIGLNHAELRDRSHHPEKYYQIKQMLLPDYSMGTVYVKLNLLRTEIRVCEIAAIDAYSNEDKIAQPGIIECLNRLSSALHIIMSKYLANKPEANFLSIQKEKSAE